MVKPVEVIARFNKQGRIDPLIFIWNEQSYHVDLVGRRWEDEAGKHFMVIVPLERVCELVFDPVTGCWHLNKLGSEQISGLNPARLVLKTSKNLIRYVEVV